MMIRAYQPADRDSVIKLWHDCGLVTPGNDPGRDIDLKLEMQPDLLFVGELEAELVATVMVGYDGHRGWINYLATNTDHRGRGLGRDMMRHAEQQLMALGCTKVNLQVRSGNAAVHDFYKALGYSVEPRVSMGKRLEPEPK